MTNYQWNGGAAATAQIETFTLNNDFNNSETALTMTMTAEDGSTQTEAIDPSGVDETTIAAAWQAVLAASTQTLFTAVTWTQASNVVTGTAKVAGVPFYGASSVTAGAGTVTDSVTTASTGPNDWNTAANWGDGAKPTSGASNKVFVNNGGWSILHGLDQSAVNVVQFRVGPGFTGDIGQTANGYYLQLDVNQSSGFCLFNSGGNAVWWSGTTPEIFVDGGKRSANMVRLDGTITTLYISGGGNVLGTCTLADAADLTGFYHTSQSANLVIGSNVTSLANGSHSNGGTLTLKSGMSGTLTTTSGTVTTEGTGAVTTLKNFGSAVKYNAGSGLTGTTHTITLLENHGGTTSFSDNATMQITITDTTVYGGVVTTIGTQSEITFTNSPSRKGGKIDNESGFTA